MMAILWGGLIVTQMTGPVMASAASVRTQDGAVLSEKEEEEGIGTIISPYWSYISTISLGTILRVKTGPKAGEGGVTAVIELKKGLAVRASCTATLFREISPGSNQHEQVETWSSTYHDYLSTATISQLIHLDNNTQYMTKYKYYAYDAKDNILESSSQIDYRNIKY